MEPIRTEEVKIGSERSFAWVMTGAFGILSLLPLWRGGMPHWWLLALAVAFLVAGLVRPALLRPLNYLWFRFGLLLHKITNPIIMALVYFVSVVPTGVIRRMVVKDPFNLRFDRSAATYWIERDPPGLRPDSMRDQF